MQSIAKMVFARDMIRFVTRALTVFMELNVILTVETVGKENAIREPASVWANVKKDFIPLAVRCRA